MKEGATKEVVFKELSIAPGQSCEYNLILEREDAVPCDITFDFEETQNLDLKKYVYVKMESDGEVFYDKLLADAFADKEFHLRLEAKKEKQQTITVTYYLPQDVGNEAQNAKSVFKLLVTATTIEEGETK